MFKATLATALFRLNHFSLKEKGLKQEKISRIKRTVSNLRRIELNDEISTLLSMIEEKENRKVNKKESGFNKGLGNKLELVERRMV